MKITICGSIGFWNEIVAARDALERRGHEVRVPEVEAGVPERFGGGNVLDFGRYVEAHGGMEAFPAGHELWEVKGRAIRDHYEKIDWADAVLVVNETKRGIAGYVGGNTLIEMGVAFYRDKEIYLLHPVSPELSYAQEILAMNPKILDGQLAI